MKFQEPKRIKKLLEQYTGTWMIAGGWAIDLYLDKETRAHKDIEIAIPRKEQRKIKSYLKNWDLKFIKSGTAMNWNDDHYLELPIHEIQGSHADSEIEILFNEIDSDQWTYRRNPEIVHTLEKTILSSKSKIPILCPEIVLLYKSKSIKEKDEKDLTSALEKMNNDQLNWLKTALLKTYANDHPWIGIIENEIV